MRQREVAAAHLHRAVQLLEPLDVEVLRRPTAPRSAAMSCSCRRSAAGGRARRRLWWVRHRNPREQLHGLRLASWPNAAAFQYSRRAARRSAAGSTDSLDNTAPSEGDAEGHTFTSGFPHAHRIRRAGARRRRGGVRRAGPQPARRTPDEGESWNTNTSTSPSTWSLTRASRCSRTSTRRRPSSWLPATRSTRSTRSAPRAIRRTRRRAAGGPRRGPRAGRAGCAVTVPLTVARWPCSPRDPLDCCSAAERSLRLTFSHRPGGRA